MSVVATVIAGIAAKVGAELVGKIVGKQFGPAGGELAETVVNSVAEKLGVEPDQIIDQPDEDLRDAVLQVEGEAPEIVALWSKGLQGQFELLQSETREGFWQSAWRSGWMYLLAVFWIWRIIIGPAVDYWLAASGYPSIQMVDYAVLLTLTTWFISLYMGGHTVKTLGKTAIDAVMARRSSS